MKRTGRAPVCTMYFTLNLFARPCGGGDAATQSESARFSAEVRSSSS
jgi:hypothetical protein